MYAVHCSFHTLSPPLSTPAHVRRKLDTAQREGIEHFLVAEPQLRRFLNFEGTIAHGICVCRFSGPFCPFQQSAVFLRVRPPTIMITFAWTPWKCMASARNEEPDKRHLLKTRDLEGKSQALLKPEDIQARSSACCNRSFCIFGCTLHVWRQLCACEYLGRLSIFFGSPSGAPARSFSCNGWPLPMAQPPRSAYTVAHCPHCSTLFHNARRCSTMLHNAPQCSTQMRTQHDHGIFDVSDAAHFRAPQSGRAPSMMLKECDADTGTPNSSTTVAELCLQG